jgi:CO/xanthine dehydrogenase FAD-binding subunit
MTEREHQMTNTHLLLQEFEYLEPASLEEAVSLLREYGDRAQVLAGGTFMLVQMKMERMAPGCVININQVPGLDGIVRQDGNLRVGACTKIHTLRDAAQVKADYTALAEACAAFGSTQIQVMGTIGGNLCNASPASDTVPALMAFDARLVLAGPDGERVLPVEEFLVGPGKTARQAGELLLAVRLDPPQGGTGSAFIKLSRVAADLAKVSVAAVLVREGDRVVDCRLAFGSVGPTVLRTRGAEEALVGKTFNAELALEAGRLAAREIAPIDDVRSTAWYRREVVKALTHDVLQLAWERAGQAGASREHAAGADISRGRQHLTRSTLRVGPTEQHTIALTVNGVRHRLPVTSRPSRDWLALRVSSIRCRRRSSSTMLSSVDTVRPAC